MWRNVPTHVPMPERLCIESHGVVNIVWGDPAPPLQRSIQVDNDPGAAAGDSRATGHGARADEEDAWRQDGDPWARGSST